MMSAATIRDIQREAAVRAAATDETPFVVWPEDWPTFASHGFPFPFLGDYVPHGWEPYWPKGEDADSPYHGQGVFFVDASGFGEPGEPALTIDQFVTEAQRFVAEHRGDTVGFAIYEAGPFQVYVHAYRKVEHRRNRVH